jgi:hypothetical protein
MLLRSSLTSALILGIAIACRLNLAAGAQNSPAVTTVTVVDGKKLSFDPSSCATGSSGHVSTGCFGATIRLLPRRGDFREFEYMTDACGGVGSLYLCQVPVDSGQVTVEVRTVTHQGTTAPSIVNSFSDEQMKWVRAWGPGAARR